MQTTPTILEGYSDMEKGAYLGALASIATADRSATEEEITYLQALCESANLSEDQARVQLPRPHPVIVPVFVSPVYSFGFISNPEIINPLDPVIICI